MAHQLNSTNLTSIYLLDEDDKTPLLYLWESPWILYDVLLVWLEMIDPHGFLRSHLPLLLAVLAIWLVSVASLLHRNPVCRKWLVAAYRVATTPSGFNPLPLLLLPFSVAVLHDSVVRVYLKYDLYIYAAAQGFAGICLTFAGISHPDFKLIRLRTSLSWLEAIAGGLSTAVAHRFASEARSLSDSFLVTGVSKTPIIANFIIGIGMLLLIHGFGELIGVPFLQHAAKGIGILIVGATKLIFGSLRAIRRSSVSVAIYIWECLCLFYAHCLHPVLHCLWIVLEKIGGSIYNCLHLLIESGVMIFRCLWRAVVHTTSIICDFLQSLYLSLIVPAARWVYTAVILPGCIIATHLWMLIIRVGTWSWDVICKIASHLWELASCIGTWCWNLACNVGIRVARAATHLWMLIIRVGSRCWNAVCCIASRLWELATCIGTWCWNLACNICILVARAATQLWMLITRVGTWCWNVTCNIADHLWDLATRVGAQCWNVASKVGTWLVARLCSLLSHCVNILKFVGVRLSHVMAIVSAHIWRVLLSCYATVCRCLCVIRDAMFAIGEFLYNHACKLFAMLRDVAETIWNFCGRWCVLVADYTWQSAVLLYRTVIAPGARAIWRWSCVLCQQLWIAGSILMRFFSPLGCFTSATLFSYHLIMRLVSDESVSIFAGFPYACAAFGAFSVGVLLLGRSLNRYGYGYTVALGPTIEAWGAWLFLNLDMWVLRTIWKYSKMFITETSSSILRVVQQIADALRWGAIRIEEFLGGLVKLVWNTVSTIWRCALYPAAKFVLTFSWKAVLLVWNNPLLFLVSSIAVVVYAYFVHMGTLQPPDFLKLNVIFRTCIQLVVNAASKAFSFGIWLAQAAWYVISSSTGIILSGGFSTLAPWFNAAKGGTMRLVHTFSHRPLEMFADSGFAFLHATTTMAFSRISVFIISSCSLPSHEALELTTRVARTSQRLLFVPILLSSVMYGLPSSIALWLLQVASMPLALAYIIISLSVFVGEIRVWQQTSVERRRREGRRDPPPQANTDVPLQVCRPGVYADEHSECSVCLERLFPERVSPLESCLIQVEIVNGPRECFKGSYTPSQIALEIKSLMRESHELKDVMLSQGTRLGKWRLRVSVEGLYQVRLLDPAGNEIVEGFSIRVTQRANGTCHHESADLELQMEDEHPGVRNFQGSQRADASGASELRFRAMAVGTHVEDESSASLQTSSELVVDVLRVEEISGSEYVFGDKTRSLVGALTRSSKFEPYVTISRGEHTLGTRSQACDTSAVFDEEIVLPYALHSQSSVDIQVFDARRSTADALIGEAHFFKADYQGGEEIIVPVVRKEKERCKVVLRARDRTVVPEVNALLQVVQPEVRKTHTVKCGHVFHEQCIASWMKTRNGTRCPVCREALDGSAAALFQLGF